MKKFKYLTAISVVLAMGMLLCSCGKSNGNSSESVKAEIKDSAIINISSKSENAKLVGILIDKCCSDTSSPTDHTRSCLLMQSCEATGYGLLILQQDGSYKFYPFDANGHNLAKQYLQKTTKESYISVIVDGSIENDTIVTKQITEDNDGKFASLLAQAPEKVTVYGYLEAGDTKGKYKVSYYDDNTDLQSYSVKDESVKLITDSGIDTSTNSAKIFVDGYVKDKILTIQRTSTWTELEGYLTRSSLAADGTTAEFTRDQLVIAEGGTLDYGIAVKSQDGSKAVYKFDTAANESAVSILSWYKKWSENAAVPVLVQGVISNGTVSDARVLRERPISGILASRLAFEEDLATKDITREYLLSDKSIKSGFGYYVQGCDGYTFTPFDLSGNALAKTYLEQNQSGSLAVDVKGYWYRVGNTIKVTSIQSAKKPGAIVAEEVSGRLVTRNYFKEDWESDSTEDKAITKAYLADSKNSGSGYGLIYKTCCGTGYYRFDENGIKLVKALLDSTKKLEDIRIIVKGNANGDSIAVTDIIETNEQEYTGTLENKDGLGITLNKTGEFLKLDSVGYHYNIGGGAAEAASLLKKTAKDILNVKITGTLKNNILYVSSIEEVKSGAFTGVIQDKCCFGKVETALDTITCLRMDSCKASGYGLVIKNSEGKNQLYIFDDAGQKLAYEILSKTTKNSSITVVVNGVLDGEILKVTSIEETN